MDKQSFLAKLLGMPQGTRVNYTFNPKNNSFIKIAWNSPNDNKANLINMLMSTDPYTLRIRDNH